MMTSQKKRIECNAKELEEMRVLKEQRETEKNTLKKWKEYYEIYNEMKVKNVSICNEIE